MYNIKQVRKLTSNKQIKEALDKLKPKVRSAFFPMECHLGEIIIRDIQETLEKETNRKFKKTKENNYLRFIRGN